MIAAFTLSTIVATVAASNGHFTAGVGWWIWIPTALVLGYTFARMLNPAGWSDTDLQLWLLFTLIVVAVAFRWILRPEAIGSPPCAMECSAFGGIQAVYTDADGTHCICRHP